MSEELKYRVYSSGDCLSEKTLFDYIDQKLSAKEQHIVEKHLLDCDLCADALEGLQMLKDRNRIAVIKETVQQLTAAPPAKVILFNFRFVASVAAAVILLIGGIFLFQQFGAEKMMNDVAEVSTKEDKVKPDEAPPLTASPKAEEKIESITEATGVKGSGESTIAHQKNLEDGKKAPGQAAPAPVFESDLKNIVHASNNETAADELKSEGFAKMVPDENRNLQSAPQTTTIATEQESFRKDVPEKKAELSKSNAAGAVATNRAEKVSGDIEAKDQLEEIQIKKPNEKKKRKIRSSAPAYAYSADKASKQKEEAPASLSQTNVTEQKESQTGTTGNNNSANTRFTVDDREDITVSGKLDEKDTDLSKTAAGENTEPYTSVDEMPKFPGGEAKLFEYFSQNLKSGTYKLIGDQTETVKTRLIIQFTIDKNGAVKNSKIIRSFNPEIDKEMLRIANAMPVWTPGKLKGKAVDVLMTLPVIIETK